jgi:hypothetical protein
MHNPEILYRIGKMKQGDLLQEAEQRRLANTALRKKSRDQGVGLNTITRLRKVLVETNERMSPSLEMQSISITCCQVSNS